MDNRELTMRQVILPFLLAFGLLFSMADGAAAQVRQAPEPSDGAVGLRACNKTTSRIEVAKALNVKSNSNSDDDIISEGWYKLNPGECVRLYPGRLQYRYYLLFAQEISGSRIWGGSIPVCVSHERFKIRTTQCGSGYNRRMFKEIDTRDERNGWTHNFTD
jgi:uncharacterized membrane protein